jgi:hypothetical protein
MFWFGSDSFIHPPTKQTPELVTGAHALLLVARPDGVEVDLSNATDSAASASSGFTLFHPAAVTANMSPLNNCSIVRRFPCRIDLSTGMNLAKGLAMMVELDVMFRYFTQFNCLLVVGQLASDLANCIYSLLPCGRYAGAAAQIDSRWTPLVRTNLKQSLVVGPWLALVEFLEHRFFVSAPFSPFTCQNDEQSPGGLVRPASFIQINKIRLTL